jgi:hypothetical protein
MRLTIVQPKTERAAVQGTRMAGRLARNYSCPKRFGYRFVRGLTCVLVLLIPMKAEIACARAAIKALPPLRLGNFRAAFNCLARIFMCRLRVMWLIAAAFCQRLIFGKVVLEML